jgi:hypothetical protein
MCACVCMLTFSDVDYYRYGPRGHVEEGMSMYGNSCAQSLGQQFLTVAISFSF